LRVLYKGVSVGDFFADIVVKERVLVELKACANLESSHEAQAMNYLRATGIRVGLLLNFCRPKLQYRRLMC
jgi:GxxExxY protein